MPEKNGAGLQHAASNAQHCCLSEQETSSNWQLPGLKAGPLATPKLNASCNAPHSKTLASRWQPPSLRTAAFATLKLHASEGRNGLAAWIL
jgi:hypothetical protein